MKAYNITGAGLRIVESDKGNWVERKDVELILDELTRLRQFHADIVSVRQKWWNDFSEGADDRYIEHIYKALLAHNHDFEG